MKVRSQFEQVRAFTNSNKNVWVIIPLIYLLLSTGCASVKNAVRDASGTLNIITIRSQQDNDGDLERLHHVEEHVLNSCEKLFTIASSYLVGQEIPIFTLIGALFSTIDCRRAIDIARQELETNYIKHNEMAIVN